MKRILILTLIFTLLLSLAACGKEAPIIAPEGQLRIVGDMPDHEDIKGDIYITIRNKETLKETKFTLIDKANGNWTHDEYIEQGDYFITNVSSNISELVFFFDDEFAMDKSNYCEINIEALYELTGTSSEVSYGEDGTVMVEYDDGSYAIFASIEEYEKGAYPIEKWDKDGNNITPQPWDEIIEDEDPNEGKTEQDIYDEIYGDKNKPTNDDTIDPNVGDGDGVLTIVLKNIPDDFKRDVLVELYERSSGNIVKIPVYAINKWYERAKIPAGNYMVYNVLAGGDDPLNPKYPFEVGRFVTLKTNSNNLLEIEYNPENISVLPVPDSTGPATDTGMSLKDTMTDAEWEEYIKNNPQ